MHGTHIYKCCQHVPNIYKGNVYNCIAITYSEIRIGTCIESIHKMYINEFRNVLRDHNNLLMMFSNIFQVCTKSFVYRGYISFHVIWGRSTQ